MSRAVTGEYGRGGLMARSRHGRSGGRASSADAGLPSWAQRHLDEAGDTAVVSATAAPSARRHHRAAAAASVAGGLRGWGVAIVSVAAAVGAVPLAVSSLANDHSDDPLPKVDTYTAGRPGPLQAEPGTTGHAPPGTAAPRGDQATAGVLEAPPEVPVARAPSVPRRPAAPAPVAVVRTTPAVVAPATPATPTATTTAKGRSATAPPTKTTTSPTKSSTKSAPPANDSDTSDSGPRQSGGVLTNTVNGLTNAVGGVLGAL